MSSTRRTPWPWSSWKRAPLVTAQLTDVESDEVAVGQPVEMVTRKVREDGPEGMIIYGYKFRPRLQEA